MSSSNSAINMEETDTLYKNYGRDLYKIGVEDDPTTQMLSTMNSNQGADNSSQLEVAADMLGSGTSSSTTDQGVGYLAGGKTKFDNSEVGYILGIDKGVAKFYLGNSTKYIYWDGSSLNVVGGVNISQLDIPDTTTANSFHVDTSGNAWWGATAMGSATAKILNTGVATFSNMTITGGSVSTSVLNIGVMGWSSDIVFTSASATQINWSSGHIVTQSGTTYNINSGNTGSMAALTYIYLDLAVSATVLQTTTTYSTATGDGKILIATAQNNTVGASVIPMGSSQPIIDGTAQISALSITAASIAASTITTAKMNVTDLSAISANMGTITAGTITLNTSGYIRGGQTAFKTGDGIFYGYDSTPEKDQEFIADANLEDYLICEGGSYSAIGINFPVSQGIINIYKITADLKKHSGHSDVIYCDIYAADSNWKPTGASLGQTSIAGITNAAYETKEFIFVSPVTVSTSSHYIFVLTSPSTTTGIYVSGTTLTTRSIGHNTGYNGATWSTIAGNASNFATYSQNVGYKFSTGNGTYQFSYNTNNLYLTSGLIVRDTTYSESYGVYGSDTITFGAKGGFYKMTLDSGTTGLKYVLNKTLTYGTFSMFNILPYYVGNGSGGITGQGIEFALGSRSNQSLYFYSTNDDNIRLRMKGSGYLVVGDLGQLEIGSSAHKATVYCSGLSSCPLPTVDSALAMFDTVPEPKEKSKLKNPSKAHFENADIGKKRKYFDIDDVPDDLTFITREGVKDIELIRVIGFLFKATKELSAEIDKLKKKIV